MSKKHNTSAISNNAVSEGFDTDISAESVENAGRSVENHTENNAEISNNGISQDTPENDAMSVENTDDIVGSTTVVYVGPTIPRTDFVTGRVFITGAIPMCERYPDEYEKFPELNRLVVPVSRVAAAKIKLAVGKNYMSEAYRTLSKKIGG